MNVGAVASSDHQRFHVTRVLPFQGLSFQAHCVLTPGLYNSIFFSWAGVGEGNNSSSIPSRLYFHFCMYMLIFQLD